MPPSILEWGISLALDLQAVGEWLTAIMKFFSFLGNEEFFLLIAPAIYWCISTTLGLRVGVFLMLSAGTNGIFKLIMHGPRPFWIDTSVQAHAFESSFGIPSGHSQNAVVFWGGLADFARRGWAWTIAALLIFFIGLSRIQLGVHFPTDVLAGWMIGIILLWLLFKLEKRVSDWWKSHSWIQQVAAALLASLGVVLLGAAARATLGDWAVPDEWVRNAAAAFPDEAPIDPLSLSGVISNAGTFFGLAAGASLIALWGGFNTRGTAIQLLARYLLGVIGVFILWFGLGQIFPRNDDWLSYLLRYMRYTLVGLWVTALAPLIFIKLRWASASKGQDSPSKRSG